MQDLRTMFKRIVHSTYALATFVHIIKISAVNGLFSTKLFGSNYFVVIIFVDQTSLDTNFSGPDIFLDLKFVQAQIFWTSTFIGPTKLFEPEIFLYPIFLRPQFFCKIFLFRPNILLEPNLFSKHIFLSQNLFGPKIFWIHN